MTQAEIKKYFKYHNSNMKLLKIGFVEIREQIKSLYKKQTKTGDYIYLLPNQDDRKIKWLKVIWVGCIGLRLYTPNKLTKINMFN